MKKAMTPRAAERPSPVAGNNFLGSKGICMADAKRCGSSLLYRHFCVARSRFFRTRQNARPLLETSATQGVRARTGWEARPTGGCALADPHLERNRSAFARLQSAGKFPVQHRRAGIVRLC